MKANSHTDCRMTTHPTGEVVDAAIRQLGSCSVTIELNRETLRNHPDLLFETVAVVPVRSIYEAEIAAFNTALKTVTLRFSEMPVVKTGEGAEVIL